MNKMNNAQITGGIVHYCHKPSDKIIDVAN